jgi:hypothetical protein
MIFTEKSEEPKYYVYGRKWVKNISGEYYTDAYGRVIALIEKNSWKETFTVYTTSYENVRGVQDERNLVGVYLSLYDAKRETERLLGTPDRSDSHYIAPCLLCGGHENVFDCPRHLFRWRGDLPLSGNIRSTGT